MAYQDPSYYPGGAYPQSGGATYKPPAATTGPTQGKTATATYGAAPRKPYTPLTGQATPGSGFGYYYNKSGPEMASAGGGISAAANQYLDWNKVAESDLLKKQQEYSMGLLGETPEQLRNQYFATQQNAAIRSGDKLRKQQMSEMEGRAASQGTFGGGGYLAVMNDINNQSNATRIAAQEDALAKSYDFGESASTGRLAAGAAPESARRAIDTFNAEGQWQSQQAKYQAEAEAARANASAANSGYERIFELQDELGNVVNVPESMLWTL